MRGDAWIARRGVVIGQVMKSIADDDAPSICHADAHASTRVCREVQTCRVLRHVVVRRDYACPGIEERMDRATRAEVPAKHQRREAGAFRLA